MTHEEEELRGEVLRLERVISIYEAAISDAWDEAKEAGKENKDVGWWSSETAEKLRKSIQRW